MLGRRVKGTAAVLLFACSSLLYAVNGYTDHFDETWITQFGAKGYVDGSYIRGEYDSPRANAVDYSGNVLVVGMTEGNLTGETTQQNYCGFIAKLTPDGTRSWTSQCQFGSMTVGTLNDVAVDGQNNIYVTGPYNNNGLVMKLDAQGNLLWSREFGRNNASEEPKAVHYAKDGSIYVAGIVYPDDWTQPGTVFVTKITSNGQSVTTKEFGASNGQSDVAGVVTDSMGNVYVAGYTDGDFDGQTNSGNQDVFLTKFDTSGNKVWTKLFGSTSAPANQLPSDMARAMTITSDDIIYIAGDTQGNLGGKTNSGNYDMFVTKFSVDGINLGTIMQGGANLNNPDYGAADHVGGISVTQDGSIYLFGTTTGQFPGSENNGNDHAQLVLAKFNPNGTYAWAHQYGPCCPSQDDAAVDIAKDSMGNLYPLARVNQYLSSYYDTRFPDVAAIKLTETNTTKFSLFAENVFAATDARGAVERTGDIVVAGAASGLAAYVKEFLFDVDMSGPSSDYTAYGKYVPALGHPIVIDPSNNTYVISYSDQDIGTQTANGYDATVVAKYDSVGSLVWVKRFNSTGGNNIPYSIAYSNGKLFIVGTTEGNIDGNSDNNGSDSPYGIHRVDGFVLALQSSDGTALWVDQFSEGNTDPVWIYDVGVDEKNYLHLVGVNNGALVLNTYHTDGSVVSFEQHGTGISMTAGMGLAISGTSLYIVGTKNNDIFLTKIDKSVPTSGSVVWEQQRGTSTYDEGYDIAVGQDGNLYIVGMSSGDLDGTNAGGTDMILESYSNSGVFLAGRQSGTQGDDKAYGVFIDSMGWIVVSGREGDSAILQRYTAEKANLLENAPLIGCINETLGTDFKHIPTLEEMESITSLTCTNRNLLTLEGVEYMPNLVYLDVEHNLLSDLTPLHDLVRLDYLNLSYNKISDLAPIQELKTLTTLHLTANELKDISTLVPFTLLETLTLGDNQIEDIGALANMLQLRILSIENNHISDISAVSGLSSLAVLYLAGNQIVDFSAIPSGVEVHGQDMQNIQYPHIVPIISYLLN